MKHFSLLILMYIFHCGIYCFFMLYFFRDMSEYIDQHFVAIPSDYLRRNAFKGAYMSLLINKWIARERKRKKEKGNASVRVELPLFPHLWEHDASSARAAVGKRKRERQDEENVEGKMYPYQRWNEIRMLRRGCTRGDDRCLPQKPLSATYWIRRASLASTPLYRAKGERERKSNARHPM